MRSIPTGITPCCPELGTDLPARVTNSIFENIIVARALSGPRLPSDEASLPGVPTPSVVAIQDAAATLQELERHAIADALAKAKGNKTAAAAALGITRMRLYTKLKRLGLSSQ
jgi:DNA-binding NtrC family response regulator